MPSTTKTRMTNRRPPAGTALFLIGMRPTKPWRLRAWLSVYVAMPGMLVHLRRHRDAGMLSARVYAGGSFLVVSYWRSADDLRRFAADPDAPHLPAWRRYVRRLAGTDSVGIWHETYVIGEHETVSEGMPPWGLAEAVGAESVSVGTTTAARRIAQSAPVQSAPVQSAPAD
ncbi:DUF4188 domain-containing protein [Gordonia sinesedis]